MIVDDEKHTRDGLRRLLEDEYDVYVAEDIGGAISVLERETVDAFRTDLRLASDIRYMLNRWRGFRSAKSSGWGEDVLRSQSRHYKNVILF